MLILARKKSESIVIGDPGPHQARVMVVDIQPNRIRLGVEAAREIPVKTEENYEASQITKDVESPNGEDEYEQLLSEYRDLSDRRKVVLERMKELKPEINVPWKLITEGDNACFMSLGQACQQFQMVPSKLMGIIAKLGIEPAFLLNTVRHYSEEDIEKVAAIIRSNHESQN